MIGTGKYRRSERKPAGVRRASRFEYSAGGIVRDGERLLMIHVQTLDGKEVWTFPKGHIEPGESAEQAALREVEEETGYRCRIVRPLERLSYWFERQGELTKKTVNWFLMAAETQTGSHDPEEILGTEWVPLRDAMTRIRYKSDKKLMARLVKQGPEDRGGGGPAPSAA